MSMAWSRIRTGEPRMTVAIGLVLTALSVLSGSAASEDELSRMETGAPAVVFAPRAEAVLSAEVTGRVMGIVREMGGRFGTGDVLLRIDPSLHEAALRRARAALAAAEAVLARELALAEKETDRRRAEAILRAAEAELDASERMYANRTVSRVELEKARSAVAVAEADAERVRVGTEARLAEARRDREAAAAEVMQAERFLEACTLRAPFAGRVAEVSVHAHETVQRGTPLLRIVNDETLLAKCLLPARDAERAREGARLRIRIEETEETVTGVVGHVSPVLDPASGTVEIHATVENADGRLAVGMNGRLLAPTDVGGSHAGDG